MLSHCVFSVFCIHYLFYWVEKLVLILVQKEIHSPDQIHFNEISLGRTVSSTNIIITARKGIRGSSKEFLLKNQEIGAVISDMNSRQAKKISNLGRHYHHPT